MHIASGLSFIPLLFFFLFLISVIFSSLYKEANLLINGVHN